MNPWKIGIVIWLSFLAGALLFIWLSPAVDRIIDSARLDYYESATEDTLRDHLRHSVTPQFHHFEEFKEKLRDKPAAKTPPRAMERLEDIQKQQPPDTIQGISFLQQVPHNYDHLFWEEVYWHLRELATLLVILSGAGAGWAVRKKMGAASGPATV